ncbi:hypothetical protein J3L18_31140 [Mucilaginibacter gossypii]|nr:MULTISPECIES: hypothetical protein [Mucilaginibacter]WMH62879.1 hypothetical protein J3L18_31140 [Mucilaginibacter gossypii]
MRVFEADTFINGSELVDGFNGDNPGKVPVRSCLAGDAARFRLM